MPAPAVRPAGSLVVGRRSVLYVRAVDDRKVLNDAMYRHLPETAARHVDRCDVTLGQAMRGTPVFQVQSYDSEMQPLTATIGTVDGTDIEVRVSYDDGREHVERWVAGQVEFIEGDEPAAFWGASF